MRAMFLILVTYEKDLDTIDALLPGHIAFLDEHYASGTFLLSGRRLPRTGGVILARADSRQALMDILSRDPFRRAGAARYEVIEFIPTKAAPGLTELL
jgi:uncharacterized protein YciI